MQVVIIGKIADNEKKIKFDANIHCTNCGKQVPGGIKAGEQYSKTNEFIELYFGNNAINTTELQHILPIFC